MKAIASSPAFFDSAEVSLARYPREARAAKARRRLTRRERLRLEDQGAGVLEVALRFLLGSSLLVALGECFWSLAHS